MGESDNTVKNKVFGDYAAFLHALLPQAHGFLFHDRHSRLFWHDNAPDTSLLDDEFHKTLARILRFGDLPGDAARIPLRDCTAYLIRLESDKGKTLGVLTALVDREVGNMPHGFCANLLKPARRSMERELSLRMHLLDATRKLSDHDCEQDFLRLLNATARNSVQCELALRDMLEQTVQHLVLDGALLYAPRHELTVAAGSNPTSVAEAEMYLEDLGQLIADAGGDVNSALQSRPEPDPREPSRCWPLLEDGKHLSGVLVLRRPVSMAKLDQRAVNLGGFVTSTVEYLLEKSFDPVTGLMSWPGFERAMGVGCEQEDAAHCIMYLDMDQLHVLNDTLGREAGDRALREMGRIMRAAMPGQALTRVTSDSFAALLTGASLDEAARMGHEVCEQVKALEFSGDGKSFRLSVSIGVAPLLADQGSPGSLLVPAQVACQAAKDRGRGRVEIYESADKSIIRRFDDLHQVGSIRSAIEGGRLVLYAQAIRNLHQPDEEAYYELLVRMLDTAGNPVPPAEFMGAAERYQLMQDLDRWVVTKAIETLTDQPHDITGRPLRFAVNLSGQSIGSEKFLAFIKYELARTGLDPSRLCFEITETVAMANEKRARAFIEELRWLGCQFALDDFGTGLSSFAYLKMFKVDKLKIDGTFVADICANEVSRSMVAAITEIAKVMGIQTVAEYVQSEGVLRRIEELGVDWAQGFHVGEPMRLRELFQNSTIIDKADLADVDPSLIEKLPA